jgi:selenocysteine lyase/cysteine desulfurase
VTRVRTEPFATFGERFREAMRGAFDLVYVSHVFFDSGYALRDLEPLLSKEGVMIVDGYHAFCAIDVDLSRVADRIFYVAGGYKYAMSGEGCCFMHAPHGIFPRPVDTGWFAAFFAMKEKQSGVLYAEDGSRFLGATFDPTGIYRFDAVMSWLEREGITTREIDERAKTLQAQFVGELGKHGDLPLRERDLVVPISETNRGQFLVFRTPEAQRIHDTLAARGVMTDVRGDRLRFGFAIYHDESDIVEGVRRVAEALI